jgi:hypothetical protein
MQIRQAEVELLEEAMRRLVWCHLTKKCAFSFHRTQLTTQIMF